MDEYILCAAILFDDGIKHEHQPVNIDTGFIVVGMRHHNCYATYAILKGKTIREIEYPRNTQGFLTSKDKFVDRKEAGRIAFEAKQIKKEDSCLFSEDLY